MNFSPKDGTVLMLYGMLSHRAGNKSEAVTLYQRALALEPGNLQAQYNLGLVLAEQGKFTEANKYAQNVYSHDFPLPGLKKKLQKAGYWKKASPEPGSSDVSKIQQ